MDRRAFRGGFTLAELLIVVVIIGIMATVAIPRFTGQRGKAEAAEAIGINTLIHRALLRYFDEQGAYLVSIASADIKTKLGIDFQDSNNHWTYETAGGNVTATNSDNGGTLSLSESGNWTGTGKYTRGTGDFWPNLP